LKHNEKFFDSLFRDLGSPIIDAADIAPHSSENRQKNVKNAASPPRALRKFVSECAVSRDGVSGKIGAFAWWQGSALAKILRPDTFACDVQGLPVRGAPIRPDSTRSVLTLPAVPQALAQANDDLSGLKKEVEALKQGQLQLQRELQEINALLRRAPAFGY
jgi:hypothetical protein